ncbi:hypothetical protein EV426DRAFT_579274 [Tirmania nivea]|nr:hypothetical protein EV426DRAFT_579274 [Tirmania nivea]
MLSLNYFVVGTPQVAGATHCELSSEDRVQSLLEIVRQHYPSSCGRVGVGELEAYYAHITEEDFDREWTTDELNAKCSSETRMQLAKQLSRYFGLGTLDNGVHVLIKIPEASPSGTQGKRRRAVSPMNTRSYKKHKPLAGWREEWRQWWISARSANIQATITFSAHILGSVKYGSKLFVREDYKSLYELCFKSVGNQSSGSNNDNVSYNNTNVQEYYDDREQLLSFIITGTPGIGKTMFGAYIICRYAQEHPDSNIVWEGSSGAVTLHADGNVSLGLDILYDDGGALYLVDAMLPTLEASRPFILFTSPNAIRFKELKKSATVQTLRMPIWGKSELKNLYMSNFPSVSNKDFNKRYKKWGGVPRSVLEKTGSTYQQELVAGLSKLDLEECVDSVRTLGYDSGKVSGTILHTIVIPDGTYENFTIGFASLYVEQQVLNTLKRNKMEEMCRFIQDSAGIAQWAATRGFVFEAVAHRVIAKGGNITVRRLDQNLSKDEVHAFPRAKTKCFDKIQDVNPKYYYRPNNKNHESVDAVRLPDRFPQHPGEYIELFQMTVSSRHTVNVHGLKAFRDIDPDHNKIIRLYFVVPSDIFPQFQVPQTYTNKKGHKHRNLPKWIRERVEQWVMRLDYRSL